MRNIEELVEKMKQTPKGIRFNELKKICEFYFGSSRQSASSHCVFKMPWSGDPRVNIQNQKGKAKAYQVKQVLRAIEKMELDRER